MAPIETPLGEKCGNLFAYWKSVKEEKGVDLGQAIPALHCTWSISTYKPWYVVPMMPQAQMFTGNKHTPCWILLVRRRLWF